MRFPHPLILLCGCVLLAEYEVVDLQHVPREENTEADALVNAALDADGP